jgi:hypothetical protein
MVVRELRFETTRIADLFQAVAPHLAGARLPPDPGGRRAAEIGS